MRVAVTSVVVFDVPDDGSSISAIRDRFYQANIVVVGTPMVTLTGQHYVLRRIEALDVERRSE